MDQATLRAWLALRQLGRWREKRKECGQSGGILCLARPRKRYFSAISRSDRHEIGRLFIFYLISIIITQTGHVFTQIPMSHFLLYSFAKQETGYADLIISFEVGTYFI